MSTIVETTQVEAQDAADKLGISGGTRLRAGSKVIAEEIGYLPTFLRDDKGANPTGECGLFVRRFRLIETKAGNRRIEITTDVLRFEDDGEMVDAIEEHGLVELPKAAENDRHYLPARWRRRRHSRVDIGYGQRVDLES